MPKKREDKPISPLSHASKEWWESLSEEEKKDPAVIITRQRYYCDRAIIEQERQLYEETKNPLHIWSVYMTCRDFKSPIPPDVAEYLEWALRHIDEPITFQFFDDKDKKNRGKASFRHMERGLSYPFSHKKQKEGCGVYAMVNAGDGKGRSKKNVVKVRTLFIDLDGSPWEPAATALKPHMRVESSPGRWHLYWLVNDCDLDQFKPIQQAIAKKFDGDKSCCDLPRVLRVPGFFHLKKQPVMTKLVETDNFPRYTTQQVIDGLGLELVAADKMTFNESKKKLNEDPQTHLIPVYAYIDPGTGEMIDLTAWAARNPGFDIVKAISPKYTLEPVVDDKQHIACPFADEHTDTSPDLATFIANANTDHTSFNIHCMHSHCVDRDRLEFLQAMFNKGWLPSSRLIQAPVNKKRPPRVYIPIDEIHASIEWTILSHEEHRIALHVAELMWSDEDGTLPNDDWLLARSLGITEEQWVQYRETLTRSGWLINGSGRLVNSIVKREFDNAQTALMNAILNGRKGGYAKARAAKGSL